VEEPPFTHIKPPVPAEDVPPTIDVCPAGWAAHDEEPPCRLKVPPAPELPEPTETVIAPPRPTVEMPDPMEIVPESDEEVVPEENVSRPEAPPAPAFEVRTRIEPDVEAVPSPLSRVTWPPVWVTERPLAILR
jgi:hypothetical protein